MRLDSIDPLRAVSTGVALMMTLGVLVVAGSGFLQSRHNGETLARNLELLQAVAASTAALNNSVLALNGLQAQVVAIQDRVTSFSSETLKARRLQGGEARAIKRLCLAKELRGDRCKNLPDDDLIESLLR